MNRYFWRLVAAMLTVALLGHLVVPASQAVARWRTFNSLPADFQDRIEDQLRQPPLRGRRPLPYAPPPVNAIDPANPDFLSQENTRLVNLLGDHAAAQRAATIAGISVAAFFTVILALRLSRSLAAPITSISDAATRLGHAELRARVSIPPGAHWPRETVRLATEFNRMAASLERYEATRKAMLADTAHELRNPVGTLQLRLDALRDGLVDYGPAELEFLQDQVSLLTRLVEDLRLLSLAESHHLSLDLGPLELTTFVSDVVQDHQALASELRINLIHTRSSPAWTAADADRMRQVMNNLLDNALRVTPAGGTVLVETQRNGQLVTVTVSDNGPGFAQGEAAEVFERFVQGRRVDSRPAGGSGLGLAIVRSIVELHGGSVRAMNRTGDAADARPVGATLEFSLPAHPDCGQGTSESVQVTPGELPRSWGT